MADLEIRNLHVSAGEKSILRGVDLHVRSGEFHALMGPNGSGKSTLANAIMGHPNLDVTEGQILFDGEDITEADPDARAVAGLFMAFQYPVAIPGVTTTKYLRMVINAHREARGEPPIPLKEFRQTVEAAMELTHVPKEFSSRYINDGFSGGEKKRMEILQMALQKPKLAVLDETDSGLDIDALNTVAKRRQHDLQGLRHGRPDHHPLPAHPAHGDPAVRAHHVRRPDRQGGRAGARRAARAARLRLDPATRSRPPHEPDGPRLRRVPRAGARGDRLPRLRGDVADAAERDRGDGPLLPRGARDRAPLDLRARRRGDGDVRGRAGARSPRSPARRRARRSSRATRPRR